jgi:hypothetical protein
VLLSISRPDIMSGMLSHVVRCSWRELNARSTHMVGHPCMERESTPRPPAPRSTSCLCSNLIPPLAPAEGPPCDLPTVYITSRASVGECVPPHAAPAKIVTLSPRPLSPACQRTRVYAARHCCTSTVVRRARRSRCSAEGTGSDSSRICEFLQNSLLAVRGAWLGVCVQCHRVHS